MDPVEPFLFVIKPIILKFLLNFEHVLNFIDISL